MNQLQIARAQHDQRHFESRHARSETIYSLRDSSLHTSERGATVIDAGIRQLGPEQWREPLDLASPEFNGLAPRRRLLSWLGDHLQ